MRVRVKRAGDQVWISAFLAKRWGGCVLLHGRLVDAAGLPALIAGDREGLATWRVVGDVAELVTLDAIVPGRGTGTALLARLVRRLRRAQVKRLRVATTNDNLDALRFYQRRGFRIVAVRAGAVERGRLLKPAIPAVGEYGIAIRDEIELEMRL